MSSEGYMFHKGFCKHCKSRIVTCCDFYQRVSSCRLLILNEEQSAPTSLPSNTNDPIRRMYIEIVNKFLLGRLLLSHCSGYGSFLSIELHVFK